MTDKITVQFCHHIGLILHREGNDIIQFLLTDFLTALRKCGELRDAVLRSTDAGFRTDDAEDSVPLHERRVKCTLDFLRVHIELTEYIQRVPCGNLHLFLNN